MIEHRPFATLPRINRDWLDTRLHFAPGGGVSNSVAGPLIAWNDDEIAGHSGFPTHPHSNVEIVTVVRDGAITHEDNLGNKGRATAWEAQVMSAGSGILHSEMNAEADPVRLFQIWFRPRVAGGQARWATARFAPDTAVSGFVPLASGRPEDREAAPINADARLMAVHLRAGETLRHRLADRRGGYLVPTGGGITLNGTEIGPGDGCLVREEDILTIQAHQDVQILLAEFI